MKSTKLLKFEDISKSRAGLMGFAIILIMFSHNNLYLPGFEEEWRALKGLAMVGVDIFFFLSGFGLYFSYTKKLQNVTCKSDYIKNYGEFILRRIRRILPTYLIIISV